MLFTVLVVLCYCTTVSSTDQYYVVTESTTDCLPADGECHPLSFYVANSSYFTNNTIFYFKEGTHMLIGEIYLAGVQNVSFIGLNQHVTINSSFVYDNPFYIYNCINISIVNIAIWCVCDKDLHYDIAIEYSLDIAVFNVISDAMGVYNSFGVTVKNTYFNRWFWYSYGMIMKDSHDVAVFNVNTSVYIYNSFGITIYDSHIFHFSGLFDSLVHCYNNLQFHNLKFINTTIDYIGALAIQHGTSYVLNVTLDSALLRNLQDEYNILLDTNSLYSISINNVSCDGGINIQFNDSIEFDYNSCQYPNTSIPIDTTVIANSYIGKTLRIQYFNKLSSISKNHTLWVDSCTLGNLHMRYQYYQIFTLISVFVVNTQLRDGINIVIYVNNIIFSNVSISSNTFGTALALTTSKLIINGSLTVSNNMGIDGGGIALYGNSQLKIHPNSNLIFIGNNAVNKGGAIYRSNPTPYLTDLDCDIISIPNTTNVSFYFINNTAAVGDDIYGIALRNPSCPIDMSIFKTDIKYTTTPRFGCFCTNNTFGFGIGCLESITMPTLHVFAGQKVNFSVGVWDVNRNITGGSILRYLNYAYIDTIRIGPNCTEISYTATANNSVVNYILQIYLDALFTYSVTLTVPFSINPCPIGFTTKHGRCTCSSSITAENVTCDIDTLQISHKGQLWIGPYNTSISFNANQSNHNICLINEQCLLCSNPNVSFMLNDTDPQCQQHKSGALCGSCATGYSLLLGSNECKECTTNYNMALIILFAFMGIALVVHLIVLNLTVSVGTINELLFTANIIKLYQPVFLGNQIPIPFFTQLISWLNLDFGIKVCFYNGMDRYVKEWLQFVFPFYIWAIIIVIILICRVSSKVSKLVGSNAVPVLATLLLLSYTKLLRTIVTVLHKRDITLYCQNTSYQVTVWYEDPTLQYAKGKHLYLFSFALIVLVLFCLPYTLFLLLNPLFEKYLTRYRLCSYWHKIKPILDAYSGPMKDEYRFWPGLLLVARIPVLLAVILAENLIQFRSLLLSVLLSVLVVILTCFQRIYNNHLHNFIETWFIFMLTIMVALSMASDSVIYTTIWYNVSIGVFTCSLIAIIGYHLYLKIDKNFPHVLSGIKEKMKSLKKSTSEDQSRLIRTPSYEIDRHDSITDLYEPVNTNDYTLPERDDSISMSVVDIHNT